MKTKRLGTSQLRKSINQLPWRLGLLLIPFLLASFALSTAGRAQLPSPSADGCYPGRNTAEGDGAVFSLTSGFNDTGIAFDALHLNTTGFENTGTGVGALQKPTANGNTATGYFALEFNTSAANSPQQSISR